MFHCTKRKSLENILKDGLIPMIPNEVPNAPLGVYLSEHPFEWMHWATNESSEAGVLIEVDASGFELMEHIGYTHDDRGIPEFVCSERIPVERFIRVSVSTDKKPTFFDEYKRCPVIQKF